MDRHQFMDDRIDMPIVQIPVSGRHGLEDLGDEGTQILSAVSLGKSPACRSARQWNRAPGSASTIHGTVIAPPRVPTLRAPADGVVTVVVAEVREAIRAGQPVLAIQASGKQWLSFNVREDFLHGFTVGTSLEVLRQGAREATPAIITELLPLGQFATWQAERAVGDHDLNMLRLRIDLLGDRTNFEPRMTVWLSC
jgi:hypothetical protein